jgi:hypothetical protein
MSNGFFRFRGKKAQNLHISRKKVALAIFRT